MGLDKCPVCGSPNMKDEQSQRLGACSARCARVVNVPQLAPDEVSRAVDRATESDKHRQRTMRGVDVKMLAEERALADESRRHLHLAKVRVTLNLTALWVTRLGAIAGLVALGLEIWRMGR